MRRPRPAAVPEAGTADTRFVSPADVRTLASLLKRSGVELESMVRGPSMGTTLPHDSHILIRCAETTGRPGEVIAFVAGAGLIAHRVVTRWSGHLITRGDAAVVCDPPVPLDAVLGPVTAWRTDGAWRPVGQEPHVGFGRRIARAFDLVFILMGLSLHPRLGRWVAGIGIRVYGRWVRLTHRVQ
ncbi:MAG: S24/S26 family peptidase [Gemmatimonadales bacterium]